MCAVHRDSSPIRQKSDPKGLQKYRIVRIKYRNERRRLK